MAKSKKQLIPVVVAEPKVPLTPEEEAARSRDMFEHSLITSLFYACEKLDYFAAEVQEHPLHALEWAHGAYKAAGELEIARQVIGAFMGGATPKQMYDHCIREALRGARNPPSSTSGSSNLSEQAKTAAFASMADDLRSCFPEL